MTSATIFWRRLEPPGHDSARLRQYRDRWHLSGSALFTLDGQPCRFAYEVTCDAQWRTRSATVEGWIGSRDVRVAILVNAAGRWSCNGREVPSCASCIDVDLSFTPATNLLPIRRLALAPGAEAPVAAAWLRIPELSLEPLQQVYRRLDEHRWEYSSDAGRFRAELRVNEHGFPTEYPPFWVEESRPAGR